MRCSCCSTLRTGHSTYGDCARLCVVQPLMQAPHLSDTQPPVGRSADRDNFSREQALLILLRYRTKGLVPLITGNCMLRYSACETSASRLGAFLAHATAVMFFPDQHSFAPLSCDRSPGSAEFSHRRASLIRSAQGENKWRVYMIDTGHYRSG